MSSVDYSKVTLPPGYRKTAKQIIDEEKPDLEGKVVVVTGATSGIGVETARAFVHGGCARLYIVCRTPEKAKPIVEDFEKNDNQSGKTKISVVKCDLSSLESVQSFCDEFLKVEKERLDILVLNAGVMAFAERTLSKDGYEMQFAVNVLANYLILKRLGDALIHKTKKARVVVLSSCAHLINDVNWDDIQFEKSYDKRASYASSKTGDCLLALGWNEKYSKQHDITVNSVHPGGIMTGLQVHLKKEEMIAKGWIDKDGNINPLFKTIPQGASTSVYVAVSPKINDVGGEYFENCNKAAPHDKIPMVGFKAYIKDKQAASKYLDILEGCLQKHKL